MEESCRSARAAHLSLRKEKMCHIGLFSQDMQKNIAKSIIRRRAYQTQRSVRQISRITGVAMGSSMHSLYADEINSNLTGLPLF
jgi:hypothetical protein